MALLYFEDFTIGRPCASPPYVVAREEVIAFAREWDPQPFHVDEELARQSMFGGVIACSAHIFAIFCKLSSRIEPRAAALAGLGFDEVRIPRPVRAGDTLCLRGRCVEARRSQSKPGCGIVASYVELTNQHGEVVFSTVSRFMVQART